MSKLLLIFSFFIIYLNCDDLNSCPPSTYLMKKNSSCLSCPPGTKKIDNDCIKCPSGYYSIGLNIYYNCKNGYILKEGESNCTICPTGTYESNNKECLN